MDSMENMVYMSYDGDNAGRLCGRAILADNPAALHEVSDRIKLGHNIVEKWVKEHGGQFISGGGDEGVFTLPVNAIENIEELRLDYEFATNLTTSIGIGKTLSESGKALLVAKFRGKNMVVEYSPEIEEEIREAKEKMKEGTASSEEKKLGEAYLSDEGTISTMANNKNETENSSNDNIPSDEKACPYCKDKTPEEISASDHCLYCHDIDQEEQCPYCEKYDEHDPDSEEHPEDCQYCAQLQIENENPVELTNGPTVKNPTTTDSEDYSGQDLNPPDLPKPPAIQPIPDGLGTTFDIPTNENVKQDIRNDENQDNPIEYSDDVDPRSEETVQNLANDVEALPVSETPDSDNINHIDDADMATSSNMEDGISRPDDFDENSHPSDMGLSEENQEEDPDITNIMKEGLDAHSENIKREKIINMVADALSEFKQCRDILEKAKEQAPQLYSSSMAMLKAMIEMAKILDLHKNDEKSKKEDQSEKPEPEDKDRPKILGQ